MNKANTMKKFLTSCAMAVVAVASVFAADADLRSIDAVDDKTISVVYPNSMSPLNAGQDLYILVRLLNQDYAETIAGGTPHPWYFKPHTAGSVDLSAAINAPMLALSIGGKRCYATYSSTGPNGELSGLNREADSAGRFGYHTDLYFKHTVEPGELGLPVKLLGKDGKVGDGTQEILIVNANTDSDSYNVWDLTNDSSSPRNATLKFVSEESLPGSVYYPSAPHSDGPHRTQDLVSEGIYVQTIDFDSTYDDEEANIWREVYPNLSSVVLNTPRLEGTGPATVYIWSENEDVFTPVGEGRQQIDGKWVLPVTISSGDSTVSFRMRGGTAAEGTTCKIYMSSSTSQGRTDVGDVLENSAVSRTIRMHKAPSPTITFRINGESDRAVITCPTNYYDSVAQLTVRLEPAVEHDVWVDLTAELRNTGDLQDIYDATLLGISENDGGDAYEDRVTRVKIPANTSIVQLYLYSLGWTSETGSSKKGIIFKPGTVWSNEAGTTEDTEVSASTAGCSLMVNKVVPTIIDVEPGLTGPATAVGGASTQFLVTMRDCYRNITDQDDGYTFYWKSSDGEELAPSENVTEEDGVFTLNQTFYTAGTKTITLYAVHPNNNAKSASVSFDIEVGKAKQISASFPGEQPWRVAEGETLPVTFTLEGGTASFVTYAFLEPANEATALAVDTNATPFTAGVAIEKGTTAASFQPDIKFLDGTQPCEFTVKLSRTRDTYSRVTGFENSTLFITATNLLPKVTSVTAGGMPVANGATLTKSVPKGVETSFKLTATDVPADLDATGTGAFLVRWVVYDGTESIYETTNNPNGQIVRHLFKNDTIGGEGALVQVYLKDKDTTDFPTIPDWSFRVPVADTPRVTLAYESSADTGVWFESEKNEHGITVGLSTAATDILTVRVKVNRAADGGYVKFKTRTGVIEVDPADEDAYLVTFPIGSTSQTLTVNELDGTGDTAGGLDIEAAVVTATDSGFGKLWSEYYESANPISPRVRNEAPLGITTPGDGSTNLNVRTDSPYYLSYKVSSDVKADLAAGITVTLTADGEEVDVVQNVTDTAKHQFTNPVRFSTPGLHTVTVSFMDKDETPTSTYTIYYDVMETKTVYVSAHGPGAERASSNGHSGRYGRAAGLGAGRVDGEDQLPREVNAWQSTFSVAVAESTLPMIAKGYQVANPVNTSIDMDGRYPKVGDSYDYTEADASGRAGYDSFFYAWLCNNSKSVDGVELEKDLMIVPALSMAYAIPLQPYEADKKTYEKQYWEAVFSREWLKSDNCGDINADGIPDLIVANYGFGVLNKTDSTLEGDDLENIADYNEDADYFPSTATAGSASFIPGLSNTWVTAGTPFEARFEIRGWYAKGGEASAALNDALVQAGLSRTVTTVVNFTDPAEDSTSTLSPIEWWAFTNYCSRIGRRVDDTTIWAGGSDALAWSPERPTDPTKADTDKDGFPDGYEYYIWYQSHVGYSENGIYKKLTGRRYRPEDPMNPTVITAEEIAALYDPRHDLSGAASPSLTTDTDNDGLTDMEELVLGTNPFDFDTDGDGLPDGYELILSKTDPLMYSSESSGGLSDGEANLDGDAMAFATNTLPRIAFITTNSYDIVSNEVGGTWIPVTNSFTVVTNSWFGDTEWTLFAEDETGKNPRVAYFVNAKEAGKRFLALEPIAYKVDKDAKTATLSATATVYTVWTTNFVAKDDYKIRYYTSDAGTTELAPGVELDFEKPVESEPGGYYQGWQYDAAGTLAAGVKCGMEDIKNLLGKVVSLVDRANVAFMHFGAYQKLGYNPLTAVYWDLPKPWSAVNTKRYTNYDEFMLITFLYQQKLIANASLVPTTAEPMATIWQKFTTDPLLADSDADGTPDGWELYTIYGPGKAPTGLKFSSTISKLMDLYPDQQLNGQDPDDDKLTFSEEFAGMLSSSFYPQSEYCTTITLTDDQKKWCNKLWATDPWNPDTDGDGINDGDEFGDEVKKHFVYGPGDILDVEKSVPGGGLNPLSWDTDGDGLPDPWELEFAGTWSTGSSTNSTASAEDTVRPSGIAWNDDGMDGTVADAFLDYDSDGLLNWQEYMVGAMRCWRYDDPVSQWTSHSFKLDSIPEESDEAKWGKFWYDRLIDEQNTEEQFNPHLSGLTFDAGIYFSLCTNAWDRMAYGRNYLFQDGVYHDLRLPPADKYWVGTGDDKKHFNRFTYKVVTTTDWGGGMPPQFVGVARLYPGKYITCDPTRADTDADGMDDYYELFHGMNPLLGMEKGIFASNGPRDIVYEAYTLAPESPTWSALDNYWLNDAMPHRPFRVKNVTDPSIGGGALWDFEAFPWLGGLQAADPDGDNIRNIQEAIASQMQAASNYLHTDPTPLWMTDSSYTNSLTSRFYMPQVSMETLFSSKTGTFVYGGKVYRFDAIPGFSWDEKTSMVSCLYNSPNNWGVVTGSPYFSFEENEGYDSDHDYLSDYEEAQGRTKAASDPQDSDSPLRRQAMWFGGSEDKSFLQSHASTREITPSDEANAEFRETFLYYTVECWAKPDVATLSDSELHTVVERAIWVQPSGPADQKYIRKNFLIGVKDGKWYTKYDSAGTDKNQPVAITEGPVATTNWTYVCASYDGKALKLYVNGVCESGWSKNSSIQPEHGIAALSVDASNDAGTYRKVYAGISYLVGASALNEASVYFDYSRRFQNVENPTFADYGNYYKGYVDEVRIWDGARSAADIESDYKNRTRYTAEKILANRQAVFSAWYWGGSRVESQPIQLPPELKYYWTFDHLPGAVEKADVMPVPAGFSTAGSVTDAKAVWARPEGWFCPWWDEVLVRSHVYTDTAWVPWINNTVSHLPRFDGTTLDSVYWSVDFAGSTPSTAAGLSSFNFSRSAEVYSRWNQFTYATPLDPYKTTSTRWKLVGEDDVLRGAYRFARRDRNVLGDDLLPMGGAYPRRISATEGGMWDQQGAADAWAQTGTDRNNRGLPDWWTRYAKSNYVTDPSTTITWETMVDYDGIRMTAWEAYRRDLARGMLPDGEYHPEYVDTRDVDGDHIPDWWEDIYGIDTGSAEDQFADADGDGLSNYAEYLISEVFKFARLNPTLAKTDGVCPDYFRKAGDLYLGEIFTDFDQVSDSWERHYSANAADDGTLYANHYVYDPSLDKDGDGWSNFAEAKVGTDPMRDVSQGVSGFVYQEHPVPTIAAKVVYNGKDAITAPIVFYAWSKKTDPDMTGTPDAIWTIPSVGTNNTAVSHTKYLGLKPTGEIKYTLGSGAITPGTIRLHFRDLAYQMAYLDEMGTELATYPGDSANSSWYSYVSDKLVGNSGYLYAAMRTATNGTNDVQVGSVDYSTGCITIDFSSSVLSGFAYFKRSNAESGTETAEYANADKLNLENSYVYISWDSAKIGVDANGTYYLSDADDARTAKSHGYVREGLNKFIAFADNDGDGKYTPGEPFGFVDNVDVGWEGARFVVELTDTHPVFARIDLCTGDSDRAYHWTRDIGITTNVVGNVLGNDVRKERVRVVRTTVNNIGLNPSDSRYLNIEPRVVLDKVFDLNVRSFLHEGDFLDDDNFDLDWVYFEKDGVYSKSMLKKIDPREVAYRIIFGNDEFSLTQTNGLFRLSVVRSFDPTDDGKNIYQRQPTNVASAVEGIYYNARPTFVWTMGARNTYTAFKVQIADDNGVVYDSGIQHAPAVDKDNVYRWVADCSFGDQTPQGKILSRKGNYKWRVTMYNSKFRTAKWSEWTKFSVAVNSAREMDDHGYSSIDVLVKYAGPSNVLERVDKLEQTNGIVRVQAFPTADFSGEPLAQTFVTNVLGSSITDMTLTQPNARLTGLPANGTYYIRAYIDSDGDFRHSAWESWGCATDAVSISDSDKYAPSVTVYIEDADTDGDWIPDAYEYAKAGWTGSWESVKDKIQSDVSGDENVLFDIEAFINGRGGLSSGMSGVPVTIFQNGSYAKILLGLSGGNLTAETLCAAVRSQSKVNSSSVKITSLTLDPTANRVVLTFDADVTPSVAGQLVSQVYGISIGTKTVTVNVYEKKTLAEAGWSLKTTVRGIEVGNGQKSVEVPLDPTLDLSSGFYKVEVVEEN